MLRLLNITIWLQIHPIFFVLFSEYILSHIHSYDEPSIKEYIFIQHVAIIKGVRLFSSSFFLLLSFGVSQSLVTKTVRFVFLLSIFWNRPDNGTSDKTKYLIENIKNIIISFICDSLDGLDDWILVLYVFISTLLRVHFNFIHIIRTILCLGSNV